MAVNRHMKNIRYSRILFFITSPGSRTIRYGDPYPFFSWCGNYFIANDCDPLLLEPVFNDSAFRNTKFVLIHGGGTFYQHTSAMLWKPNVFADISLLTRFWTPHQLPQY